MARGVAAGAAVLYGTLPFDAGVPTTSHRLAGTAVLVVHGDADVVIPRDLLERTWAYLHDSSGATTTGFRDPGGHGLGPVALGELRRWLEALLPAPQMVTR